MIHPGAFAGNLKDNPVRDDIEETADFISVDFILNVALDDHKRITFAAAGHPVEAHRKACAFLDKIYKKKVKKSGRYCYCFYRWLSERHQFVPGAEIYR